MRACEFGIACKPITARLLSRSQPPPTNPPAPRSAPPATHPIALNLWVAEGVSITGMMLLALPPRVRLAVAARSRCLPTHTSFNEFADVARAALKTQALTVFGVLSGAFFVLSALHAVLAISRIGLAAASGIWCGVAVLVSAAWGIWGAGERIHSPTTAALGIASLLVGIGGIAAVSHAGGAERERGKEEEVLLESGGRSGERQAALPGLVAAVVAGALGGMILAPMTAAPAQLRGPAYLPSMAVGTLLTAPLTTTATLLLPQGPGLQLPGLADWRMALVGMAGGAVWNAGNLASILATSNPRVGLAVAYPIMQAGLFVAGLWGMALGELPGARIRAAYLAAGAVLLAGAALLAAAK